jgi:hypothetical protein
MNTGSKKCNGAALTTTERALTKCEKNGAGKGVAYWYVNNTMIFGRRAAQIGG